MIYITTELSHHGVKGMKWGVRRKEKYSKEQISQRRKELVAQAPKSNGKLGGSVSKTPTKGYWKNASDAQIRRLMESEAKVQQRKDKLERKIGESATKTAREVTNYKRTSEFVINGRRVIIKNKASDKYYKNAHKYQSQGEKYMKKYKKKFGVQVYGRTGIDYSKGEAYIQVKYGENGEIREYR